MLLSKARAKEYLLENLKYLSEWKKQQVCVWKIFHIHSRPLLCCWLSKVKWLIRSSSYNRNYFSKLQLQDLAHSLYLSPRYEQLCVLVPTYSGDPRRDLSGKCGNLSTHCSITDQQWNTVYGWPLFKNLLNSETNHWNSSGMNTVI